MTGKLAIYIFISFITIWSIDSININTIFKKNKQLQATIIYFLLTIAIIYLVSNFIFDIFESFRIF